VGKKLNRLGADKGLKPLAHGTLILHKYLKRQKYLGI